jgi:hypothetical protein
MNWHHDDASDDASVNYGPRSINGNSDDGGYYSDGAWHYPAPASLNYGPNDSDGDWHYAEDDEEEMIESDSLRRRNIISSLQASSLQHLSLTDELWESSVTMESFQPADVESIIVALQSNRSLEMIDFSSDILAAIGESDQRRFFFGVGNLPTLQRMFLYGDAAIHMRILADALSGTSNDLKVLRLSDLKINSRSEVEQLARGLKARVDSLKTLILDDIVLGVEDKTGFLDPILLALAPVPG